MKARVERVSFKGAFRHIDEAEDHVKAPGEFALVDRGVLRSMVLHCPCGCGDILVINLDSRAGPAWRVYRRHDTITLYPSYWRDSACESHFILWDSRVWWCTWDYPIEPVSEQLQHRVLSAIPHSFIHYKDLADQLDEIPWDILDACQELKKRGLVIENTPARKGEYRRSL